MRSSCRRRPEGVTAFKWTELKVGSRGWVDLTGDVVKVSDGVAIVRPAGEAEGVTFGLPVAADAATVKAMVLRGEYIADRPVTIDGREVIVLKEAVAAKALDGRRRRCWTRPASGWKRRKPLMPRRSQS